MLTYLYVSSENIRFPDRMFAHQRRHFAMLYFIKAVFSLLDIFTTIDSVIPLRTWMIHIIYLRNKTNYIKLLFKRIK